ncbi:MAG: hypothetical protein ABSD88_20895, partial [Candidatus Korobacteraceae bacterium]
MNFSSKKRKRTRGAAARFYRRLLEIWGAQNWWPAESRFEVLAGAILTQNTSWKNVEQALRNLRAAGALSLAGICRMDCAELETLLRPAGYFRQKSRRLKDLAAYIVENYGSGGRPTFHHPSAPNNTPAEDPGAERSGATVESKVTHPGARKQGARVGHLPDMELALERMLAEPTEKLRNELLRQKGVGPETADSILLYAGDHPVFVVDAYTRRIFERHNLVPAGAKYDEIRQLVEQELRDLKIPHPNAPKNVALVSRPGSPASLLLACWGERPAVRGASTPAASSAPARPPT